MVTRRPEGPPSAASSPERGVTHSRAKDAMKRTLLIIFGLLLAANVAGAAYYLQPVAGRVRSPLHAWLRPSGYLGQSLGILALLLFLFLWLYPIRKRFRKLAVTGSIPRWLHVHVIAGLTVPFVAATHAGWRFTGLAGLGFAAMVIVWASGIVGRYLYTRIPRSRNGLALSLEEIAAQRESLVGRISAATGLVPGRVRELLAMDEGAYRGLGLAATLRRMVADDLARRRAVRGLRARLSRPGEGRPALDEAALREVMRAVRQEIALGQQIRLLEGTHRVFKFWHAAHKPVAVTALVAVAVHVAVVIAVGSTWFR